MARGYGRNYIQNNALIFGNLDWIINFAGSVQLYIVSAQALPPGWTGKLWAIEQGIQAVETRHVASLEKTRCCVSRKNQMSRL